MTGLLTRFGPGLLLAATGVGAGDLATAAFAGSHLGTNVLWAVALGALFKFALNEGLARWQLITGIGFFAAIGSRFGRGWLWLFLPYLLLWSYFVGLALISACGLTAQALLPLTGDLATDKLIWGVIHSLAGIVLVRWGGFQVFEVVMRVCIALMFAVVLITAMHLWPGWEAILSGFWPRMPSGATEMAWTLALIGGVGGTVTILCYGYWVQVAGREGAMGLHICRADLALAYLVTALFGFGMIIIGSTVEVSGRGAGLIASLADALESSLGPVGRVIFLLGAWGAVFSSLLGVWQAVPYLFADLCRSLGGASDAEADLQRTSSYRRYQLALAILPLTGMSVAFIQAQKLYAIAGACFVPLLALALLLLNGRKADLGRHANGGIAMAMLIFTLLFFGVLALD